jgi:hypothetical protein
MAGRPPLKAFRAGLPEGKKAARAREKEEKKEVA